MNISRRHTSQIERVCLLVTGLSLAGSALVLILSLYGPTEPPPLVAARPAQIRSELPAPPQFQTFASSRANPF